jgi:hypothetical protein
MTVHPQLIREAEAAAYLGLAPTTLARWRWRGDRGPKFVKLGSAVRYSVADLDIFIANGAVER